MLASPPISTAEAELADEISRARSDRRTIPGRRGLLDLDAAYRVQRLRFAGRTIVGAKMLRTGSAGLVHGPVVPQMLLEEPVVDLDSFVQPHVRPDLATVLSADVSAHAEPGDVARAITGVFLAVDVVDTIWAGYDADVAEAVADGVGSGAFLLGEQLLPADVRGELRLRVGGELVATASLADLGDPVTRVGWLAVAVGGLRAGDVVFLGSPAAHVEAAPGTLLLEGPRGATISGVLEVRS